MHTSESFTEIEANFTLCVYCCINLIWVAFSSLTLLINTLTSLLRCLFETGCLQIIRMETADGWSERLTGEMREREKKTLRFHQRQWKREREREIERGRVEDRELDRGREGGKGGERKRGVEGEYRGRARK